MKKRNKLLVALGLAGILGAYWYFNKDSQKTEETQVTEVSGVSAAKESKKAKRIVIPRININQGSQEEKDEFRDYIDNLELVPPILYKTDEKCDEKELREGEEEHKRLSTLIENWDKFPKPRRGHGIWPVVDMLIAIDTKLANCLYNRGDEEHKKVLEEMTSHLDKNYRYAGAGRLNYYLNNIDQARKYFEKDKDSIEALIKLTPAEELPSLKDKLIADKKYLEAGKVAWYQGDKQKAREYFEQSPEFKEALEEARDFTKKGEYGEAIDRLWMNSNIPFFREIMKNLCKGDKNCLKELEKYDTSENVPVMSF